MTDSFAQDRPERGDSGAQRPRLLGAGAQAEEARPDVAACPDQLKEVVAVHLEQVPAVGRHGRRSRGPVQQAELAEDLVGPKLSQTRRSPSAAAWLTVNVPDAMM